MTSHPGNCVAFYSQPGCSQASPVHRHASTTATLALQHTMNTTPSHGCCPRRTACSMCVCTGTTASRQLGMFSCLFPHPHAHPEYTSCAAAMLWGSLQHRAGWFLTAAGICGCSRRETSHSLYAALCHITPAAQAQHAHKQVLSYLQHAPGQPSMLWLALQLLQAHAPDTSPVTQATFWSLLCSTSRHLIVPGDKGDS